MSRSAKSLRFAVVGDVHFVRSANVERQIQNRPECFGYDTKRYARMSETVLPMLVDEIREAGVDFIVQLGDFQQGQRDHDLAVGDFTEALRLLESAAPTFVTRGTHDFPDEAFAEVVVPHNADLAGKDVQQCHFSFERSGSLFLVVDTHPRASAEQWQWLESELTRGDGFEHVFVCGHEPMFNVGRPFFTMPEVSARMGALFVRHQVDCYFCGHTHNQNITMRRGEQGDLLQVKSCAIGDTAATPVPLDEVRTWLLPQSQTAYWWPGYVENSAPGWVLGEVDGGRVRMEWRRIGDGPHVQLEFRRGHVPKEVHRRPSPVRRRLSVADLERVRRAWLCLSVDRSDDTTKTVTLSGTPVGEFPAMVQRYHHRTEIPKDALPLLGLSNELRIVADPNDEFCVSSVHLSAELDDGTSVRSSVSPHLYSTSSDLDAWELPTMCRAACASDLPPIVVSF